MKDDWRFLCDKVKVREDSRYLRHQQRPVVLLWGLGYRDRPWSPEPGEELIWCFKEDPECGGVYLIGGADPHWRTLRGESRTKAAWSAVYRQFDAISPWNAGRYRDDASMDRIRREVWEGDLAELKPRGVGYLPTVFPGFSWDNPRRAKPGSTMMARRKGGFYGRQFAIFRKVGIRTVLGGMFDEVDEGTTIHKVANATAVGKYLVTCEGLPADWSEVDRRRHVDDAGQHPALLEHPAGTGVTSRLTAPSTPQAASRPRIGPTTTNSHNRPRPSL